MNTEGDDDTRHGVRLRVRVRTPADLVAAIPYLLGFHPRDSLVLVSTRTDDDPRVAFVSRVDLPAPEHVAGLARYLAEIARVNSCDEVLLAVVGGGVGVGGVDPRAMSPRQDVVDAVAQDCVAVGIQVRATVWVGELVAGATWRCYGECGCAGVLPDPASSPLAAATVAAGQVTYADRTDLQRLVAPADPAAVRRRSALLDARCDLAAGSGAPGMTVRESFALLRGWVERAGSDQLRLDDDDVVALCMALSDPVMRDVSFGFATGGPPGAAERLWTVLVTEAPDPEAAEPAVLLAHCALLRGNGALAGIALERAQQAWPGHRLSAMFQSALDAGLGPDELAAWFDEGAAAAEVLLARCGDR